MTESNAGSSHRVVTAGTGQVALSYLLGRFGVAHADRDAALARVASAVCSETLAKDEEPECRRRAESGVGDVAAAILALRLERHLSAELAGGAPTGGPTLLVLRSRFAREPGGLDLQLATVLAAIHARVDESSTAEPLIVLAHPGVMSRLRVLLAASSNLLAGILHFVDDPSAGVPTPGTRARVEMLEAQSLVDLLDKQLPGSLVSTVRLATEAPRAPKRVGALKLGQLFHGKYRIVRRIGGGGFGVVYEALDERGVKNRVAIKILRSDAADLGQEQFDAFRDEARRLTRLDHAHIVNWKSFDEAEDGTLYLVMELVEGQELDKVLQQIPGRRMPARRVQRLLLQILDALRAAHDVGKGESILHLDLKPNNVFVVQGRSGGEHVKIIDFGIGQYVGGDASLQATIRGTSLAAASGAVGAPDAPLGTITLGRSILRTATMPGVRRVEACTPEYAAPEHCRHVLGDADIVPLDGRSDLYSVGVMAFQMLTGRLPYTSVDSRYDIVRQHVVSDAQRMSASGVRVPRDLGRFVDKLLARDRDQRWSTADEAWHALQEIVSPPAWKTGLKMAAVVGVIAAVTAWITWPDSRTQVRLSALDPGGELVELGSDPIHLGPDRPSVRIQIDAKNVDWNRYRGSPLRLTDASGGAASTDWRVEWARDASRNEIVVEHVGDVRGKVPATVRVTGDFDDLWLEERPLRLVWLGADAWSLGAVRVRDSIAPSSSALQVDPEDLQITVEIAGSELTPADFAGAEFTFGDSSTPRRTAVRADADGRPIASESLPWPWPEPTSRKVVVVVRDRAGHAREETRELTAVTTPLLASIRLLNVASEPAEECVRTASGEYVLSPLTKPCLAVRSNRDARLTLNITKGERPIELPAEVRWEAVDEPPDAEFRYDLASLLDRLTDDDSGVIAVEVRDIGVVRALTSTRGLSTLGCRFAYTKDTARLRVLRGGDALTPGEERFTKAKTIELALESDAAVPILAEWRLRAPGLVEPEWISVKGKLTQQIGRSREELIRVEFADEGLYTVEVRAYRTLAGNAEPIAKADAEYAFPWRVARVAPTLAWVTSAPSVLRTAADLDTALGVRVESSGSGAPVASVHWRLERDDGSGWSVMASGDLAPDPQLDVQKVPGPGPIGDGTYRFIASGTDRATNPIADSIYVFQVSTGGPQFSVPSVPQRGSTWDRDPERQGWRIQVRVEDPNGIDLDSVSATVRGALDDGGRLESEPSRLDVPPEFRSVVRRIAVVEGFVAFDERWSGKEITLELSAKDACGTPSAPFSVTDIEIGDTRPRLQERVVRLTGSAKPLAMRLIRGNTGAKYTFGGRGDDVEAGIFRQAGLGQFKKGPARGEQSFRVDFADGVIGDFYLDEDEVARAEFLEFVDAGERGYLDASHWPLGASVDRDRHARWLAMPRSAADASAPVTEVTWDEAAAYAHWIGKRLPSLVEWEYAVRDGARSYRPYSAWTNGGKSVAELVNFAGSTLAVSKGPWSRGTGGDVTGDGLRNLSGNVREWTSTPRDIPDATSSEPKELARSHSAEWLDPRGMGSRLSSVSRFYAAGAAWDSLYCDFLTWLALGRGAGRTDVGFRCAISADEVRSGLGTRWGAAQ